MGQPVEKISVSLPANLARAVRARAGQGNLSGFVAQALAHELERERLGSFLAELDRKHGKVDETVLEATRKAWRKR